MDTIEAKRFLLLVHGHSYFPCRKYQASPLMREKRADALDRSFYSYFIVSFFFSFFSRSFFYRTYVREILLRAASLEHTLERFFLIRLLGDKKGK